MQSFGCPLPIRGFTTQPLHDDDDDIYGISLATILPDRPLPLVIQRDLYVPRPPSHLFTYEADQLFDAFYAPHCNNHFLPIYYQTYLCSIPSVNNPTTRHRATYSIETPLIHSPPNTVISIAQPITPIPSTPHSSVFHEARELASPDFTMAPLPLDTPNDPSPERTTPITSNNPPDDEYISHLATCDGNTVTSMARSIRTRITPILDCVDSTAYHSHCPRQFSEHTTTTHRSATASYTSSTITQ